MKLKLSRLFVTLLLLLACVALVLLAQAQGGNEPNKCRTDWDFCNSGTEAENEYYWRLGWCAAAIERGAVSASPSACMGQEEGTVSFPSSSRRRAAASGTTLLQEDVPIDPDGNACDDWGDFCNTGTPDEIEYKWRLGWCVWAVGTGTVLGSVSACMGEPEGTVSHPPWSPHPEGTPEPSPPTPEGGTPSSPNPGGDPPSPPTPGGDPPSPPRPSSTPHSNTHNHLHFHPHSHEHPPPAHEHPHEHPHQHEHTHPSGYIHPPHPGPFDERPWPAR